MHVGDFPLESCWCWGYVQDRREMSHYAKQDRECKSRSMRTCDGRCHWRPFNNAWKKIHFRIATLSPRAIFSRAFKNQSHSGTKPYQQFNPLANTMTSFSELGNDWQAAPAEHEIANYDAHKIQYRQYVQDFIKQVPKKNLCKKAFFTIATNVLCADKESAKPDLFPIDRDIYLPLEIAISKWCLSSTNEPENPKRMITKVWMINPGKPTHLCNSIAKDHALRHKIDFDYEDFECNQYIETDLTKIIEEINSFLSIDRIVFSIELKHVRQDLGSIKWLVKTTEAKCKPIKVLSLEDLYVVLSRSFVEPERGMKIGQGLARHRMYSCSDCHDPKNQCVFHQQKARITDGETRNCAKGICIAYTEILIRDVSKLTNLLTDQVSN